MQNKIDLYIVSGFLGAGKTTFLQKMLENFEGKKIGVLMNEFGAIGIDGRLIERDGIQLVEINNGSIFCSCLKGGFIKALIEFSKSNIDILLIENSGMADPSNIHQILDELVDKTERSYQYKGAICIVDSVSFLKYVRVLAPVQNQVASSNLIIINKKDLVNQQTIKEIEDKLHQINPEAYIYRSMYSEIPLSLLEHNLKDNGYIGETSNQLWNRPATYSLESSRSMTREELLGFIHRVTCKVLRIKGFVMNDHGWWQVDVVEEEVKVSDYTLGRKDIIQRTKLVIIGKDTECFKNLLVREWNEIFQESPVIYNDLDGCQV